MKIPDVFKNIIDKDKTVTVGALFIPIPQKSPVLVFKSYLGPLQRIKYYYAPGTTETEQTETESFISYWKEEFIENKFPPIVDKNYPIDFIQASELKKDIEEMPKTKPRPDGEGLIIPITKLLYGRYDAVRETIKTYNPNKLPKGCFELRLSGILNPAFWPKVKNTERGRYKLVRETFKQCGLILEPRGKNKKTDPVRKQLYKFLKGEYGKLKKKKPLPVSALARKVGDKANELFPNDHQKALKYYFKESTIRRVLKNR